MPDLFDRLLLLKQSPIFSEVATDDLRLVARLLEEQAFFAGDLVFRVGEQGSHLYIVVSGKVGISLDEATPAGGYIATLGPGECFGEMNLLDDLPRSASACATEDTFLLTLEKTRLRGLLQNYPEIGIGMLRSLSLRVREANNRMLSLRRNAGNGNHNTA
jgi:CRP/FNR family cyclic AMP-dependent transcriptional regulator